MGATTCTYLTLRLQVRTTPDVEAVLRETMARYAASVDRVCAEGWASGIGRGDLQRLTYSREREATGFPSSLVTTACSKATEALRSAQRRLRQGLKASCPQARRGMAVRYSRVAAKLNLAERIAFLDSHEGRQWVTVAVPSWQAERAREALRAGFTLQSSDLIDREGKLWLHVAMRASRPDRPDTPEPRDTPEPPGVVGVDLGVVCPAVTSQAEFFGERRWRGVEDRYLRLRRALQKRGTKSAKRRLRKLSGRLERFRRDCDHVLSRRLVDSVEQGGTLALEDLTGIRRRMRARRPVRRRLHSWSFARLLRYAEYKAALAGVLVSTVNARYTSQTCSRCGYRSRANRRKRGEIRCRRCGFALNADLNAARNIAHRAECAIGGLGGSPSVGQS